MRPAAVAADGKVDGPPGPYQHRQNAVRGRDGPRVQVEAIAVRLRIEVEEEAVAAAIEHRGKLDQRAARVDVRLARQATAPWPSGNLRADVELSHVEPADPDIEPREDGPALQ